jgi:hypothetical protein
MIANQQVEEKLAASNDIESTAYHEAGHAVMAYLQDVEFEYVTVEPNDTLEGHVRFNLDANLSREYKVFCIYNPGCFSPAGYGNSLDVTVDPRIRFFAESQMLICAAGPAAELIYQKENVFKWKGSGLRDLIAFSSYAESVTVTEDECSAYCEWMQERVWALMHIPSHQKAIRALAKALIKRGTINYSDAEKIIGYSFKRSLPSVQRAFLKMVNG